jgi:hypothetical protein
MFFAKGALSARPGPGYPYRRALVWMRQRWGAVDPTEAVALVAAAPNPVATATRRPGPAGEPMAHPVTIELERRAQGILIASEGGGPGSPRDSAVSAATGLDSVHELHLPS